MDPPQTEENQTFVKMSSNSLDGESEQSSTDDSDDDNEKQESIGFHFDKVN